MPDEKQLTTEEREAAKADARAAASKELSALARSTREVLKADQERASFVSRWEKDHPHGDFLKAVNDGSATDREYASLLKIRHRALEGQAAADQQVDQVLRRFLEQRGLASDSIGPEANGATHSAIVPPGRAIADELREESKRWGAALLQAEQTPAPSARDAAPSSLPQQQRGRSEPSPGR